MRAQIQHILSFIAAALLTLSPAFAASVNVTLVSAGPANDGVDFVLPYQLDINGVQTDADCYDFFDMLQVGDEWLADELTLSQAAQSGIFSGAAYNHGTTALANYEEVAWLSSQSTLDNQAQIDLQHDLWNVFDPGAFTTVTPGMQAYLTAWQNANTAGFDPTYFDNYLFLEASSGTPGNGTYPQTFVLLTTSTHTGELLPEPRSIVFVVIGLGLIGFAGRLKLRAAACAFVRNRRTGC